MIATSPEPPSKSADNTRGPTKPTERDYEMYRRHCFDFTSQSELAKEHGISQQRVSQVLRNVERWVAGHPEDEEAQQVRRGAGDRWEAVIALSMRSFRKSQQDQEVVKERTLVRGNAGQGAEPDMTSSFERTVRPQCGDVRYLHAAMRAMEKQARLFPNGDIIPRVLLERQPAADAVDRDVEAIAEPEVEAEEPMVEPVDVDLAQNVVAIDERLPATQDSEPQALPKELQLARTHANEPRPIIHSSVGPVPDPRQPATLSRIDSPHKHASCRQRRRQRAQHRADGSPPRLDISAGDGRHVDVSICGPSPGG